MPIYEYRCQSCGAVFARLQSVSAPADSMVCPECGGSETERLLSAFAAGSSSSTPASCGAPAPCGGGGG